MMKLQSATVSEKRVESCYGSDAYSAELYEPEVELHTDADTKADHTWID